MKTPALVAALLVVGVVPFASAQKAPPKKAPAKKAPAKAPAAAPTISVLLMDGTNAVPVKDGAKLTGERTFRVRVQATDPISSVEFYVGDDLRDTDGSTPYEFKFDALNEEEGKIKLTFKGYTSKGTSATKVLNLVVDNGGGVPVDEHVRKGREALSNGNADAAIDSGRIALKVDPNNNPARLLLARAYLAKNQFDRAQKYSEDALAADANSTEAREILGSVGVQRAFASSGTGSDRTEALKAFGESLGNAADARAKVNDSRFQALPADAATTDPKGYADAAFVAGRYSAAVAALKPAYDKNTADTAVGNRLAYAYLMSGDPKSTNDTLASIARYGKYDAYTYALQGLMLGQQGNVAGADEAFKNGALENADSLGLRTAQASYLLQRNRPADRTALAGVAAGLGRDSVSRPEVNFYLASVANRLQDYSVSRANFIAALRVDPANSDMYIEQGSQALTLAFNPSIEKKEKEYQLESARTLFEVALKARPNSAYAFAGLAIVAMEQNKTADAVKNADLAVRAGENVPLAHYVLAGALSLRRKELLARITNAPVEQRAELKRQESEAGAAVTAAIRRAGDLDVPNLQGRTVPGAEAAYRYLAFSGRAPVLTPPSLG